MLVSAGKPDQTLGSLKTLQWMLSHFVTEDRARTLLTPLVGIYELRLGDAHLPQSEIAQAFALVGLDRSAVLTEQAKVMIDKVAATFAAIRAALHANRS